MTEPFLVLFTSIYLLCLRYISPCHSQNSSETFQHFEAGVLSCRSRIADCQRPAFLVAAQRESCSPVASFLGYIPSYSHFAHKGIGCASQNMPLSTPSLFPSGPLDFAKFNSRRSVVHSTKGIVACTQPLAAKCGIDILNAGGNAAVGPILTYTYDFKKKEMC